MDAPHGRNKILTASDVSGLWEESEGNARVGTGLRAETEGDVQHNGSEGVQKMRANLLKEENSDCELENHVDKRTREIYSFYNLFVIGIVIMISFQGLIVMYFQQQISKTLSHCKFGHDSLQSQFYQLKEDIIDLKNSFSDNSAITFDADSRRKSVRIRVENLQATQPINKTAKSPHDFNSPNTSNTVELHVVSREYRPSRVISRSELHPRHSVHDNAAGSSVSPHKSSSVGRRLETDHPVITMSKSRHRRRASQAMYSEGNQNQDVSTRLKDSPIGSRVSRVTHPWLALTAFSNIPVRGSLSALEISWLGKNVLYLIRTVADYFVCINIYNL